MATSRLNNDTLPLATTPFRSGILVFLVILSLTLLAAILAYRSGVVGLPDGVNILADGDFEDGTGAGGVFNPGTDGVMSVPEGTTIPGWTVVVSKGRDVAWLRNQNSYVGAGDPDNKDGHFLDLTGKADKLSDNGTYGAISQTFTTAAHKPYHLSFDIMVFPSNTAFSGPITVDASISEGPGQGAYAQVKCGPFNPTASESPRKTCGLDFNAATPSTTLTIVGSAAAHNYIGLDKVSVECRGPLGLKGWCS